MGQQSNAQKRESIRQYREQRRQEAIAKQKKQDRMMWTIVIGAVALVVLLACLPAIFSLFKGDPYEATDYVQMNVSYTDNVGEAKQGTIVLELYGNLAPITVKNFTKLTSEGFYNGLTFHRIIEGFMIQGGDPKGDGSGNSGERIKGEFNSNGVQNDLLHERGVISMARGSYSMNSASCQFFIVHQTSPHLDGDYAAFGRVIDGMDTVDAIAVLETNSNDKPLNTVTITSMTVITKDQLPQNAQEQNAMLPAQKERFI